MPLWKFSEFGCEVQMIPVPRFWITAWKAIRPRLCGRWLLGGGDFPNLHLIMQLQGSFRTIAKPPRTSHPIRP